MCSPTLPRRKQTQKPVRVCRRRELAVLGLGVASAVLCVARKRAELVQLAVLKLQVVGQELRLAVVLGLAGSAKYSSRLSDACSSFGANCSSPSGACGLSRQVVAARLVGFRQVSRTYSLSHLGPELVGVVQVLGLAVTFGQVLLAEAEVAVVELEVFRVLLAQTVRVGDDGDEGVGEGGGEGDVRAGYPR